MRVSVVVLVVAGLVAVTQGQQRPRSRLQQIMDGWMDNMSLVASRIGNGVIRSINSPAAAGRENPAGRPRRPLANLPARQADDDTAAPNAPPNAPLRPGRPRPANRPANRPGPRQEQPRLTFRRFVDRTMAGIRNMFPSLRRRSSSHRSARDVQLPDTVEQRRDDKDRRMTRSILDADRGRDSFSEKELPLSPRVPLARQHFGAQSLDMIYGHYFGGGSHLQPKSDQYEGLLATTEQQPLDLNENGYKEGFIQGFRQGYDSGVLINSKRPYSGQVTRNTGQRVVIGVSNSGGDNFISPTTHTSQNNIPGEGGQVSQAPSVPGGGCGVRCLWDDLMSYLDHYSSSGSNMVTGAAPSQGSVGHEVHQQGKPTQGSPPGNSGYAGNSFNVVNMGHTTPQRPSQYHETPLNTPLPPGPPYPPSRQYDIILHDGSVHSGATGEVLGRRGGWHHHNTGIH